MSFDVNQRQVFEDLRNSDLSFRSVIYCEKNRSSLMTDLVPGKPTFKIGGMLGMSSENLVPI